MARPIRYQLFRVLWILAGGLMLLAACSQPNDAMGQTASAAKDFKLTTLDGSSVKLSSLKGKVVVLDFWATWCPPCRKSLPHIQALSADEERAKKGLRVVAINAQESADAAKEFLRTNNYTFTVALDSEGKVMRDYNVDGIPTTVIINRDGTVRKQFVGFDDEETAKAIDAAVDEALSGT